MGVRAAARTPSLDRRIFLLLFPLGFLRIIQSYFHYIFYRALEDIAQHIDRMGRNIHVLLQTADLSGADAVILNQAVLTGVLFLHSFPQSVIAYHILHLLISLNSYSPLMYIIHIW